MHDNVPKLYPNPETSSKVIDYSISKSTALPDFLTNYHAWGVSQTEVPDYLISAFQAQMLTWFTRAVGAQRVLEIGVYIGFSGMMWANAVGPHGQVVGLELSEKYAGMARKAFDENNIKNMDVLVGDGVKTLETMEATEPFDVIFLDANKNAYPDYLEIILRRSPADASSAAAGGRLLKPGGLIVADNVLRRGLMADMTPNNPSYAEEMERQSERAGAKHREGLERFNTMMVENARLDTFLMPMFDGLGMARLVD